MGLLSDRDKIASTAAVKQSGHAAPTKYSGWPKSAIKSLSLILCDLGRHRPAANARWNQGYGFTRCERCGRNLVRSLLGEWHVPKKHRVVWRAPTPAPVPTAPPRPTLPDRDRKVRPVQLAGKEVFRSPFVFDDFDGLDPGSEAPLPRQKKPS
jgi:hypothetical protein